jgi:hypothetical protein
VAIGAGAARAEGVVYAIDGGGCPVGLPRAVMKIKHPVNPKSECCCILIVILLQDELQDFKCARINQV